MLLRGVTYQGPPIEDPSKLQGLPHALIEILWQVNGFIAYAGGLHVRGLVDEPEWHSLERYHSGEMALHRLFREVERYDFPFAQDFLGNQFLLRDNLVWRLRADTGEVSSLDVDLAQFLGAVRDDPIEYLSLHLLASYHQHQGFLEPGHLVHTMPPLCMKPPEKKLALKAAPAPNVVLFLADFARQIEDVPDGAKVNLRLFKPPDGGLVQ